jgi:NO-binding membrane sensor protein with MHYT domain
MMSDEETNKFLGIVIGISVFPVSMLMIFRQPDGHQLVTVQNALNILIGIVSAIFCGMVASKVAQPRLNSRLTSTLLISVTIGAASGGTLFALLSEVVKRFQQ